MASSAIFIRTRSVISSLSSRHGILNSKSITTLSFLLQEAQLDSLPTPSEQSSSTPLPPNPASGSPFYNQNWRNPYPPSSDPNPSPVPYVPAFQQSASRLQEFSQTLDVQGLKDVFVDWMTSLRWSEMKQLFEYWVRSLDSSGKPNVPDVDLYNHYLRANLMNGALPVELLDLVEQMDDFGISPNTASFNLVLKAMNQSRESVAAEKLLQRMLQSGKESLPDDESYNLVIGMLFVTDIDTALRTLDIALKSGYTMSRDVFRDFLWSCSRKGNLDAMVSVIERCQKMDQNKALCPDWRMCSSIADIAVGKDNKDLAYHALKFMARWIARGELARPPVLLSVNEGLIELALGTAARTYCPKLLDGAWEILKRSLRQTKAPNPGTYVAKIHAYSSLGNLPKAFSTLREFESAYKDSNPEAIERFLSPNTSLRPLVMACSKKGFVTLDEVYYQLENLSKADPPYKSVAALNCVIHGFANIWDVDGAYLTFNEIENTFGLKPNVHSYNGRICAFGKLKKRDEAAKVFEHLVSISVKPNYPTPNHIGSSWMHILSIEILKPPLLRLITW